MSHSDALSDWGQVVATNMPCLSAPQARVLSWWSYGIVFAGSCTQPKVALCLATMLGCRPNTTRQRLRDWLLDAKDKHGPSRRSVDVDVCFEFLLRWIVRLWEGDTLVLALDATTHAERHTVLTLSVLYRGCAIPVFWRILPGNVKHPWRNHWLRMLRIARKNLRRELTAQGRRAPTVLVLTDRGITVSWLFRRIRRLGWHPLLRMRRNGTFCPAATGVYQPLTSLVPRPGTEWSGEGTAFKVKGSRIESAVVLAYWHPDATEAWFLLPDLLPDSVDPGWYALRMWIEQGFRTLKRGGWQWEQTRRTDTRRTERLWLTLSVATLWSLNVGSHEDDETPWISECRHLEDGQVIRQHALVWVGVLAIRCGAADAQPRHILHPFKPEALPTSTRLPRHEPE